MTATKCLSSSTIDLRSCRDSIVGDLCTGVKIRAKPVGVVRPRHGDNIISHIPDWPGPVDRRIRLNRVHPRYLLPKTDGSDRHDVVSNATARAEMTVCERLAKPDARGRRIAGDETVRKAPSAVRERRLRFRDG